MEIKVLGPGCPNCQRLERTVREALRDLGAEAELQKVTDYPTIMSYGILSTPGLVVNGTVRVSGRVPGKEEVRDILMAELAQG